MDMFLAYRIRGTTRREIEKEYETGDVKRCYLREAEFHEPQNNSIQRHRFAKCIDDDISRAPSLESSHVVRCYGKTFSEGFNFLRR
jgi:hypothetical protein